MMVTKADNSQEWIFVVDKVQMIRESLEVSGLRVRYYPRAAECLTQLRSRRCDLLITDLRMAKKNGLQLLEQVREVTPWVSVVIVTRYGDIPTAVRAIKGGAVDFIEKPFRKAYFMQKIKLILRQSRMVTPDAARDLTLKEMGVLRLIVEGKSNRAIAGR